MAALVECMRCHGTFDGERFIDHCTDGTCQPPTSTSWLVWVLAMIGAAVALVGLLDLAAAATAVPGGVASWVRVVVAAVFAVGGTAAYTRELHR